MPTAESTLDDDEWARVSRFTTATRSATHAIAPSTRVRRRNMLGAAESVHVQPAVSCPGLKLLSPGQCLHVSFLESFGNHVQNNAGETHQPGFLGASLGGSDQNARFDRLKVLPRCRLHAPARTYARKH